jgi:hypothetical protein
MGRALILAGTAGMVYGVYLWLGTAAAVMFGSFALYVVGYHLATRRRAGLVAGEDLSPGALCSIGADGRVYAATPAPVSAEEYAERRESMFRAVEAQSRTRVN